MRGEDGAASGVWGERGVRWRGGGVREEGVDGGGIKEGGVQWRRERGCGMTEGSRGGQRGTVWVGGVGEWMRHGGG